MTRTTSQKNQKGNCGLEQHYRPTGSIRHIQNTLPTAAEYTVFSIGRETLPKADCMLDHKTNRKCIVED